MSGGLRLIMHHVFVGIVLLSCFSQGWTHERKTEEPIQNVENIEKLVTFRLYTSQKPENGVQLTVGDKAKLQGAGFKGNLPTIICSHGYFDHENSSWIMHIKKDVMKQEAVNFITLDYSQPAKNLLYNEVVNFTKEVGRYAGQFLKFLQTDGKCDLGKAHLIGHSLGAQVLGFAAKAFPNKKPIGRISALDPAGPLFENAPESERLNPDSAKLVDVIHTCTFFVGMKKPVGTIDFYPNGGFHQPGCGNLELTCHHARSREYFYKTIDRTNRNQYQAKRCETLGNALNGSCDGPTATMGYHLNYSSPGLYYLKIE